MFEGKEFVVDACSSSLMESEREVAICVFLVDVQEMLNKTEEELIQEKIDEGCTPLYFDPNRPQEFQNWFQNELPSIYQRDESDVWEVPLVCRLNVVTSKSK
jgi:hypothetical protein